MITTKFIRLHSKALAILEMIQSVNNRIEENRIWLKSWDSCSMFDMPKLMYNRCKGEDILEKNQAIKDRLVSYYASTVGTLCKDTLAKCYNELQSA